MKPYPRDFKEWLEHARARYPRDAWKTQSRFSWSNVRLCTRSALHYMDMLQDPKDGNKPKMPETDLARVIAAYLEPTSLVCNSKMMHFDGNR